MRLFRFGALYINPTHIILLTHREDVDNDTSFLIEVVTSDGKQRQLLFKEHADGVRMLNIMTEALEECLR